MQNRLRLLMGATALLYLGPLVAGLSGAGWPAVYAFAGVFVAWLAVMRPADWPRDPARWRDPAVPTKALAQAVVQVVLVAVCFGIGRGIGGVAGMAPDWPVIWPLALSALSIPLSYWAFSPVKAAEMDLFLDEALTRINALGREAPLPAQQAMIDRAMADLQALPPDAPVEDVHRIVRVGGEELPLHEFSLALKAWAEGGSRLAVLAFLLHATDGETAEWVGGDLPTRALTLLQGHPDLIPLYVERMQAALDLFPGLWLASPSDAMLSGLIAAGQTPLIALRDRLRELAPQD